MFGHRYRDKDVERLLSGKTPDERDLAKLAPFADALRRAGGRIPPEAEVARFAEQAARLAQSASEHTSTGARRPADVPRRRPTRLTPKVAGVFVLVVALLSTTGIALAANGAVPGDSLYGFDRALEKVGLGAGGLHERLSEASVLADRGSVEEGVAHAEKALSVSDELAEGSDEAQGALALAGNALRTADQGQITQLRQQVAEMLRWMATTQAKGADFGRGASEFARAFAPGESGPQHGASTSTTSTQPTSGSSGGPGSTTGGQSDGQAGPQGGLPAGQPGSTTDPASTTTSTQSHGGPTTSSDQPGTSPSSTGTTHGGQGGGSSSGNHTQGAGQP